MNALHLVADLTSQSMISCRLDKRTDADANLEKAKEVSGTAYISDRP